MRYQNHSPGKGQGQGVAAVELAVLLPFLVFIFVLAVDFSRVFYAYLTITNCARNGAIYGSQSIAHSTDVTGITSKALADATNLQPSPQVSSSPAYDAGGNRCVQVTVTMPFQTVTNFPGIPSPINLTQTVQMRVPGDLPQPK